MNPTRSFFLMWFDGYNPRKWMEDHCLASNRRIEMDWMTFFYRIAAEDQASPVNFASMFGIYNRACTGSPSTKCSTSQSIAWQDLDGSAVTHCGATDARYVRFITQALDSGVAY